MTIERLLSTKLQIPPLRRGAVARPFLAARLEDGLRLGHSFSLLSAPAGFGKTTLIREWIETTDRPVGWLSIDDGDNDPIRFLRYLVACFGRALEHLRSVPLQPSPSTDSEELVVALINGLAKIDSDLLLVIDDYHLIRDFSVHEQVAFVLENQPKNLHVVIATREDPPLPLARMRARAQVTEIRERALRFSEEEADLFLNQTMSLDVSPASVTTLTARTEGWITGLQLVGLALRQSSNAQEFVAAFAGDDRYIVDYLLAEVLDRQPEEVHHFLRQTSVLVRLCAPLCDALTGRDDSQAMLEQLEAANLFVVGLDHRREWYRYHGLFSEAVRLGLTVEEQIANHETAASWFQAQEIEPFATYHLRQVAEMSRTAAPARRKSMVNQSLVEPLSAREIEVLQLIAAGLSNREIADRLVIAPGTVKRHSNNIYGKLDVRSRTQAVARARDLGLL
jgi:LuxR family maltose regulon positive regulatory protein